MQDSNYTHEEAGVEFSLTANAVKTLYDQLDFDECLKKDSHTTWKPFKALLHYFSVGGSSGIRQLCDSRATTQPERA
ncbi:hypothetical protein K4K48_008326 [Colletotrichum sp. SAR 10_66]|nr:hypothetical protein K4K48_008326 [Colletotrichum sp. SAR 10_66]